jgi:hypothetical protein
MTTETQHRENAAKHFKAEADSFERSDTDGFLSQWSSSINGQLELTRASIVENGGVSQFAGLFEGNRRVKAQQVSTKWGIAWVLHEDEIDLIARRGKKFLPFNSKSRVLRELGLRHGKEQAPAAACFAGNGSGLGSLHTVFVKVFRTGCKWGTDAREMS